MIEQFKEQIKKEAHENPTEEICGVILEQGDETFWRQLTNIHNKKESDFRINPEEIAALKEDGFCLRAVVHTHPKTSAKPSPLDIKNCAYSRVPWYIYSLRDGSWEEVLPLDDVHKLVLGREFKYNVFDCFTVVQDYYMLKHGIYIPRAKSEYGWWDNPNIPNPITTNLASHGFAEVSSDQVQEGDVLLMKFARQQEGHLAVYTSNGMILQHLDKRLAGRYIYHGYWKQCVSRVLRHESRMNLALN